MVEAAFQLESLRQFACGTAAKQDDRIVVDVDMSPRFAASETCPSRVFAIYRDGQPTNSDAVLRLTIGSRDAQTYELAATYFDPPNSPDDHTSGTGFDDVSYHCAFIGGHLARSATGWRAWVDAKDR